MKNKSDIMRIRDSKGDCFIVVLNEKGKEVFRKPYSPKILTLAHTIYMGYRYPENNK